MVRKQPPQRVKDILYPYQPDMAEMFQHEKSLIICKSRQTTASMIAGHFSYWLGGYGQPGGENILIVSKQERTAKNIIKKIKVIPPLLPEWLRPGIASQSQTHIEFSNGNLIECIASTPSGGRGDVLSCIIFDEFAHHPYADQNMAALVPTLDGQGHFIIISTGNGIANEFYSRWQGAKAGTNGFRPYFISWRQVPGRDEAWYEAEKKRLSLSDELMAQEHPDNDVEAFVKSGSSPFNVEWIAKQKAIAETRSFTPVADVPGRYVQLRGPEEGRQYAAGLDVAAGMNATKNPDQTCLWIADRSGNHVAEWTGKLRQSQAAPVIRQILSEYFDPFLVVEINAGGLGYIGALESLGYDNFYRYEKYHFNPQEKPSQELPDIGFPTGKASKAPLVRCLAEMIDSGDLYSDSVEYWDECSNFIQKTETQWQAGRGKDDRVMASALCAWGIRWYEEYEEDDSDYSLSSGDLVFE